MRNNLISSDPSQGGFGSMGGDIGSILGMIFGNSAYKNPADAAMGYFDKMQNPFGSSVSQFFQQIPGSISPYLNPYVQQGQNAGNMLQGQYGQLLNDPSAIMNKIGGSFQSSPGYEYQKKQMMNAVNNAAAAGGYMGSPQAQQRMAENIGGLANQDYWNYMNKGLGLYGQGLQGEQGLNQLGFGASSQMAQQLADALRQQGMLQFQGNEDMNQALANQAQLAYAGQANKNQQNQGFWSGIGSLAGDLFSFL